MTAIKVTLEPRIFQKTRGNLTVDVHLDDWVVIENLETGHRQSWGYCPLDDGPFIRGTWLPLSGFPMELGDEVQRQINIIRGYEEGKEAEPPKMIESGRTAAEQEADGLEDDGELDDEFDIGGEYE